MEFRKLTPIGRADRIIQEEVEQPDEEKKKEYYRALRKYRKANAVTLFTKLLLYAGLITSFAATFGLNADLITKLSSYLGITLILILYLASNYLSSMYREVFLVRRELLIGSQA